MTLAWIGSLNGPHQFASPIFIASIRRMSLNEQHCCIKHNRATEEGLHGMAQGRCEAREARCCDSAWVMTFTVVVSTRFMWPTQQVHSKYLKASVLWAVISCCNTADLCSFLFLSLLVEIGLYNRFAHKGMLLHLQMILSAIVLLKCTNWQSKQVVQRWKWNMFHTRRSGTFWKGGQIVLRMSDIRVWAFR